MSREQKIKKDSKALKNYAKRLENEHKVYMQTFSAYAVMDGSLEYLITEQKLQDPDGLKRFHCSVTFRVVSQEKAHTDEEIRQEIEKTFDKMMMETDEMFPPEEQEYPLLS